MIVELPNGQELEFPDGTSPEIMRAAIAKNFPEYSPHKIERSQDKASRYGKDILGGIAKLGENVGNIPNAIEESLFSGPARVFGKVNLGSKSLDIPDEKKDLIDKLLQFAPELVGSMIVPETKLGSLGKMIESIPKAGKYLQTGIGNAISQGLFAASQAPNERKKAGFTAASIAAPFSMLSKAVLSGNPALRNLARFSLGGAGLMGGYEGAKKIGLGDLPSGIAGATLGGLGYKGLNSKRRAYERVLEGVEGTPYKESLEAAERLGLKYITPAEASGNPFTGGIQGTIGTTPESAKMLYKAGQERAASETKSIQNLMHTIFNPEDSGKISKLYESAFSKKVPQMDLKDLKNNEIFKEAVKNMNKSSAYREDLKGVPKNSIKYLDYVKEALYDMAESAPRKEAKRIDNMRSKIVGIADNASPEYKEARSLYERKITRDEIQQVFDKKRMEGTPMAKFLKSDAGFEELQHHLRNVPEAQQQLKDMKLIFHKLMDIPTAKTAAALARTSMSKERSTWQALKTDFENKITGGKYDKSAIELITNPKWAEELEKLKHVSKEEEFVSKLINLFGKVSAQTASQ